MATVTIAPLAFGPQTPKTLVADLTGAAASLLADGPATLYAMYLLMNVGAREHLKLYNANAVTVGTTVPDIVVGVPSGQALAIIFQPGIPFSTNIVGTVVLEAGTGGTTARASLTHVALAYVST